MSNAPHEPGQPPLESSPYQPPGAWTPGAGEAVLYPDRTVGLVLFGIVQIGLGLLCALLVPLMAVSVAMQGPGVNAQAMIPAMGIYSVLAAVFIALGIGSIRTRRWARALTLVLASIALAGGILAMAFWLIMMPNMLRTMAGQGQMPREAVLVFQIVSVTIAGVIYVGLPGIFVLFYSRPAVRATCEAKSPPSWTDRAPLPVLTLSLIQAFSAASLILSLVSNGVFLFFGTVLTGISAVAATLLAAILLGVLAWGSYRQHVAAWWGALGVVILGTASFAITLARVPLLDIYKASGMTAEQLQLIQNAGMIGQMQSYMPGMMLLSAAVGVGYLIYVRKFFPSAS